MKNLKRFRFLLFSIFTAVFFAITILPAIELPEELKGSADKPVILLELGKQPASLTDQNNTNIKIYSGKVFDHLGDDYISEENDEIIAAKKGFGEWAIKFMFKLDPQLKSGTYILFARWKQGGDATACQQTFKVFAGTDESKLENRGTFNASYTTAWEYGWVNLGTINIKDSDTLLGIRNSGNAHDAKVFDCFALMQK